MCSYSHKGVQKALQMHRFSGSINKTTAMPDMPKPNKKKQAAHRELPNKEQRKMKREGRCRFLHYSSNLVSDQGQQHGLQSDEKAVTISGKVMRL